MRAGTIGDLGRIAVSDRAFTLRLESLPHASFLAVLVALTARLRTLAVPGREWVRALAPFATGLYAIDDTTLDALARKVATLVQHPKRRARDAGRSAGRGPRPGHRSGRRAALRHRRVGQ